MSDKYYIGLDIGTNSVGWAVTDEKYNLIKAPVKGKYKNHDMWGIRLFDEAKTAEERRLKRSNRRRRARQVNRIKLLQELFAEEILKIDETFFQRLNESRYHIEDRSDNIKDYTNPLFKTYKEEKDYFLKYPTIYHLRKALIDENDNLHKDAISDIRKIYLACHHIIKNRGHFLQEGDIKSDDNSVNSLCMDFENAFNDYFSNEELKVVIDDDEKRKLSDNLKKIKTKKDKNNYLKNIITIDGDADNRSKMIEVICKLLSGYETNFLNLFCNRMQEKANINFSSKKYLEEIKDNMFAEYPDEMGLIEYIEKIYNKIKLDEILDGKTYISDAKIKMYKKHKEDLNALKKMILKYKSSIYDEIFRKSGKNSYSSYVGHSDNSYVDVEKNKSEFFGYIKKIIEGIIKENSIETKDDLEMLNNILIDIENSKYLELQRNFNNAVIPYQINKIELLKILENASKHYPFLNKEDEYGTIKDKVVKILEFRIPYFVGPLSTRHKDAGSNSWIERKQEGKIYPWNFDDMVDLDASNENFINRMTNKCTYLIGEDVLPKNSLLYKKFMVLNEINLIKVSGKDITVEEKQSIYNELFLKKNNITRKRLLEHIQQIRNDKTIASEDITGIDVDIKSNMSSYLDFKKKIFNLPDEVDLNDLQKDAAENIIKWITIYDNNSKSILKNKIKKEYPDMFREEQLKKILTLKYSGWGKLSKTMLQKILSNPDDYGELRSIIKSLWDENCNLMELLSKDYGYLDEINYFNNSNMQDISKVSFTYNNLVKDLYVAPANKRAIWQSLKIVKEIEKIMKKPPKKIFVEMARGGGKKGKRTDSRKKQICKLYDKMKTDFEEYDVLNDELEKLSDNELRREKVFLYFLQQGKCAYSGEDINLSDLLQGSKNWDVDHIYPQSKFDIDELDNKVLVKKKYNEEKRNKVLDSSIQNKMKPTWKYWLNNNLITRVKYNRLIRTEDFKPNELASFAESQIVETRQSSKEVARLLEMLYKDTTKIKYVKANLVSKFRKDFNILKSRKVNDFHHAKDAYLNIVVGDVYSTKYTDNPRQWFMKNKDKNYSIRWTMFYDVFDDNGNIIWSGATKDGKDENGKNKFKMIIDPDINDIETYTGKDIDRIRSIVRKNTCMYTEMTYIGRGKLFNDTIVRKGDTITKTNYLIPLKDNLEINKYGAYESASIAYFVLIEFDFEKKGEVIRKRTLQEVPILVDNKNKINNNAIIEYLKNDMKFKKPDIIRKILINSVVEFNGHKYRLRSYNEKKILAKNSNQLKVTTYYEELIRRIEKACEKIEFSSSSNKDSSLNTKWTEEEEKRFKLHNIDLNNMYDCILEKLNDKFYVNMPSNQFKNLDRDEVRNKFTSLSENKKCYVLNQILNNFSCKATRGADLSDIKLFKGAGESFTIAKNMVSRNSMILINQSITGLFENRLKLT